MKKIYIVLIFFTATFSFKINAQCSTPSVIPYYEGFQSISSNNQLPPCWAISSTVTCATYTAPGSGSGAAFYYLPAGSNYFYSNGISLSAGVVYSISAWYSTFFYTSPTWSDFSLLLNTSQSSVGALTIVSTNGTALASVMTALSNTFSVPSSNVYYVAIKGVSNGNGLTNYLSFDDLAITIPCTSSLNTPSVSIVSTNPVFCEGAAATLIATGANTYSWSNSSTTTSISVTPISSQNIFVTGTSSLSGCSATASLAINVVPSPTFIAIIADPDLCLGESTSISILGNPSYSYQLNGNTIGTLITISPTVTSNMIVSSTSSDNCSFTQTHNVIVHPLPNVQSFVDATTICAGDSISIYATGAYLYQWQGIGPGDTIAVYPTTDTAFQVIGTDLNGCMASSELSFQPSACLGINTAGSSNSLILLAPNPFQNEFLVKTGNYDLKKIEITDLSGRIILAIETQEEKLLVNTKYYANGLYYVKVSSGNRTDLFKMIKN